MTLFLKRHTLLLFLLAFCATAIGQTYTISGSVTDSASGETLIGAAVMDLRSGKGALTNDQGRFSLTLKSDSVRLRVTYVGYQPIFEDLVLKSNQKRTFQMHSSVELKTVVVTSERVDNARSSQMSAISVPIEQLKSVPVLFGEADLVKALQLLPGVQSGSEGNSGFYVRGGGPDENLFLLDGIPLYNVNHLGGFFSAFNSDAIKNVTLYKGSFPARFSGRISSVLDITTNNGNDREWHGSASLGAIAAKFSIEGPLVKERTTMSLSFRRTYFDLLLQPLLLLSSSQSGEGRFNGGYYFYDLNAKFTHRFNDRSRLYASLYSGDDAVYARVRYRNNVYDQYRYNEYIKLRYAWGNLAAALRWNYVVNPRLFMNITGAYTRYRNRLALGMELDNTTPDYREQMEAEMSFRSGIHDFTLKADFDYSPRP